MVSHGAIKILNAIFVWSFGLTALWLLYRSLAAGMPAKKTPGTAPSLLLNIEKEGAPYLRMPLVRKRYILGRDAGCDITLRGAGMPGRAGTIRVEAGGCLFESSAQIRPAAPGVPAGRIAMPSGCEVMLADYRLRIESLDGKER